MRSVGLRKWFLAAGAVGLAVAVASSAAILSRNSGAETARSAPATSTSVARGAEEIGTMTRPAPRSRPKGERWAARWNFRADDLAAISRKAEAAFVGKVVDVRAGPSIGGDSVHHAPGEYELPTELVTL